MPRFPMYGVAVLVAACAAAGCGGTDETSANGPETVIVAAAASLAQALTACQDDVAGVRPRLSFAGSDELAAQIRQGVEPDVYLAANTELPAALAGEGLVGDPAPFATNDLVLAVPRDSHIASIDDLTGGDVTVVMGSESVPVGAYTREVLSRLGGGRSEAIVALVRSEEPDVKGVVGKLVQGAADAGFVYDTDVLATNGELKAIALPSRLRPTVAYGGAIVEGAPHPGAARSYLDSVLSGACAAALRDAGFGAPPA